MHYDSLRHFLVERGIHKPRHYHGSANAGGNGNAKGNKLVRLEEEIQKLQAALDLKRGLLEQRRSNYLIAFAFGTEEGTVIVRGVTSSFVPTGGVAKFREWLERNESQLVTATE